MNYLLRLFLRAPAEQPEPVALYWLRAPPFPDGAHRPILRPDLARRASAVGRVPRPAAEPPAQPNRVGISEANSAPKSARTCRKTRVYATLASSLPSCLDSPVLPGKAESLAHRTRVVLRICPWFGGLFGTLWTAPDTAGIRPICPLALVMPGVSLEGPWRTPDVLGPQEGGGGATEGSLLAPRGPCAPRATVARAGPARGPSSLTLSLDS